MVEAAGGRPWGQAGDIGHRPFTGWLWPSAPASSLRRADRYRSCGNKTVFVLSHFLCVSSVVSPATGDEDTGRVPSTTAHQGHLCPVRVGLQTVPLVAAFEPSLTLTQLSLEKGARWRNQQSPKPKVIRTYEACRKGVLEPHLPRAAGWGRWSTVDRRQALSCSLWLEHRFPPLPAVLRPLWAMQGLDPGPYSLWPGSCLSLLVPYA